MTCTPQALVTAAICYTKMSKTELSAAEIYLLCQWANHLTPPIPGCQFQGLPWMDTPSLIFTGDEIGIQSPLHIPPPPPYDPTYAVLAWGTTSGVYSTQLTVPAANFNAPFALLTPPLSSHFLAGTTYYFVVRTFDNAGHCSELSNELSHLFPGIPHASTPVWLPTTEQVTWTDTNGTFTGDYPTFAANVSVVSLTSLVFGATGNLTSLTNLTTAFNLVTLDVNTNALTTLNCTGLAALTTLNCSSNASLTTLTLTGCTGLVTLDCSFCNITGTLDVTPAAAALTTLNCSNNSSLTAVTLTGCTALTLFDCDSSTSLTTLTGLHDCSSLVTILIYGCDITGTVDVSGFSSLATLFCFLNPNITAVNTTNCTALDSFRCESCSIISLDVSTNTLLTYFDCSNNPLGTIDVSTLTSLTLLHVTSCGLAILNLASNVLLNELSVDGNTLLVSLDLSTCSVLTILNSFGCTSLANLNIGASPNWTLLDSFDMALTTASVDDVLLKLRTNCLANAGFCDMSGGTSSAPTVSCVTLGSDCQLLLAAGWGVNTN